MANGASVGGAQSGVTRNKLVGCFTKRCFYSGQLFPEIPVVVAQAQKALRVGASILNHCRTNNVSEKQNKILIPE